MEGRVKDKLYRNYIKKMKFTTRVMEEMPRPRYNLEKGRKEPLPESFMREPDILDKVIKFRQL